MFDVPFSVDELMTVRNNKPKCRKTGGWDLLISEHIKHAGFRVEENIDFCFMIKILHIPKDFKRVIRIPIYKGVRKDSTLRENHRGITLLPVLSKFFELLVMGHGKTWFERAVDPHQGAALSGFSSLYSTIFLKETMSYVLECSSDAYAVLLDAKQTFNTVWHEGLFYQIFKYKINYKLWFILRNYYTGFKCSVKISGIQSFWFDIKLGIHQDGVFSNRLY